ncbi:unnamed protein product [Paramecium sonneborni]|uniref:Uncharacterized protein n=1 Tax=Paramecium sonneborni TaxID=65129 RepID=A0A8S1RPH5_9CILI|nr:unnamed protein product [Paramecium sonneborni]
MMARSKGYGKISSQIFGGKYLLLFQFMNTWAQVFETGEYSNNLRIGSWIYQCYEQGIVDGFHNKYWQKLRVSKQQINEYIMNERKVGIWDIMYDNSYQRDINKLVMDNMNKKVIRK